MKPRIYCFGHGWAIDIPGEGEINGMPVDVTHYMGRFEECLMQRLGFQEIGRA